ncbi:MAG: CoA-binding protein [Deltaproteobacteria bacterium SG8_13]|nr:MAG: CoA-binding protein [Deltaproteobacteria bacterium SG8_13]
MSVHNLQKIFHPASVTVVGASEDKGKIGGAIMRNLIEGGFQGKIIPVNPHHTTVQGRPCTPCLKDLAEPVDLAVIAVPIEKTPDLIRQCARLQIGGAVLVSAGGKETGSKGLHIEGKIRQEARESGLRIIGPNTFGIISTPARLNVTFATRTSLPGKMAFVSQSGAISSIVLDIANKERIGFSYLVNLGSMMDVDFGDLIDYFGGDPGVSSIVMYVENIPQIRNFMSAARSVSRIKPIVALKAGRTPPGVRAAASHTGALAGEDSIYEAAFKRAGIVRVKTFEELFDCAELLAKPPRPTGPGVAVVTNAGGPGVMAADALFEYGLEPARLTAATIAKLDRVLSSYWSRANPIDMIGDATAKEYQMVVDICMRAPEIHSLLILMAPVAMIDSAEVARELIEVLQNRPYPIITCWMGAASVAESREAFNQNGIPTFDTPERAVRAFADLYRHRCYLGQLQEVPARTNRKLTFDHSAAEDLIRTGLVQQPALLTEVESKALLQAYGIPVNPTEIACTAQEAVSKAESFGFPVVMKIMSRQISHKSDVGGVALNLQNAFDVQRAFAKITERMRADFPAADISGVSIQPMLTDRDHEILLGLKQDRHFGPVILFGAGGTAAELLKDRTVGFPPLNRILARRLMEETKIYQLLHGFRDRPPANIELLEEMLIRLSQLAIDFPEIAELDINPLVVSGSDLCAVDSRVLLAHPHRTAPHHLIISPYPARFESRAVTTGLVDIFIRPIRPEDAELVKQLFHTLSSRSIYYRFFSPLKELPPDMLARLTQIDYDREIALVAVTEAEAEERMLGAARVITDWSQKGGEFSVLVADPWQGKGIGSELLKRCLFIAGQRGLETVHGVVLSENTQMLRLAKKLGFTIHRVPETNEFDLVIDLQRLDPQELWKKMEMEAA